MKNKTFIIIGVITIIVLMVGLYFLSGGRLPVRHYSLQEINNPMQVTLPINSDVKAIQYSLSIPEVKSELNNPSGAGATNPYNWWVGTIKIDNYRAENKVVWAVSWSKGNSECESPHACQIIFEPNGNIVQNFSCSDMSWCG